MLSASLNKTFLSLSQSLNLGRGGLLGYGVSRFILFLVLDGSAKL